jgi:hypothetical protein
VLLIAGAIIGYAAFLADPGTAPKAVEAGANCRFFWRKML